MRRICFRFCCLLIGLAFASPSALAQSESLAPMLDTLRKVEKEGKSNRAAAEALAKITATAGPDQLPIILAAIDGAGPLAANWLHAAVDTIAERQLQQSKLPTAGLEAFLQDKKHDGRARRLAYEWIVRADPAASDRWVPQMLDDPSLELRRDAVARLLTTAAASLEEGKNDQALATYRKALASARDLDQVKVVTEALKKLGQGVNLPYHFGFLIDWKLVGPFDNRGGAGFDHAYPPETSVDLNAEYETPQGAIRWIQQHTDDDYGIVDLNKALGKHMGAAAYAMAEFQSASRQPVELRLGSQAAYKIWLNGRLLSMANVYHANGTMDQYIGRGELQPGKNIVLLKIGQNEQKEEWAQDWNFQLRACDALGTAILSTDRRPPRAGDNQTAANSAKE
jgi:hypothetical protein